MGMISVVLVAAIALLHIYILVLEMFLWQAPRTRAAFGTSVEFAAQTRVMAANQGLYNGFLAAGLIWSLWLGIAGAGHAVALFFLTCVLVAGVFGAVTASKRILFVQALPSAVALAAVLAGV
jgi:putative membrane protein